MKIATWNVNSIRVRLDALRRWCAEADPDVVCLQETKCENKLFPASDIAQMGYPHQAVHGQKTYNGVAILSKHPLGHIQRGFSHGEPDPQARLVGAVVGGVRVLCCYVPNGNQVGSDKFAYKLDWVSRLRLELNHTSTKNDNLLICGDFNIAPADADVWDPFKAEGKILFHPDEHRALAGVTSFGLTDALRHVHPTGRYFSWWDYRGGGFPRNRGFRIDHHYLTEPLVARCKAVTTYRDVRGWERPSDHVPVMVELDDPG